MIYRIPKDFINELLIKIDIVEIIERRITLKKKGSSYSACCPFHSEKTPSFTVSNQKQFYYCFGCGAHGNVISFLMNYERLSFVEAVEELAHYLGIPIPQELGQASHQEHTSLYDLLKKVTHYYEAQLSRFPLAQSYLHSRGLSTEIIQHFGIGFAPPGWNNLQRHFGKATDIKNQLMQTGMVIEKSPDKTYDRFRNRIMIPIKDSKGHIIAFGGRILDEGTPKYLNSPETLLFHKGSELFGLHEARQLNASLNEILVVEGYMDVIALHQYGITQAVATLGTATSQKHLQRLFRYTQKIIFCFDGDSAGQSAAWRALETSLPALYDGIEIRFMFLPQGEDPDTLIRKEGLLLFKQRMVDAIPLTDFMFNKICSNVDMNSIDGKAKLTSLAKNLLNKIHNNIFQQLILEKLASLIGMDAKKLSEYTLDTVPTVHIAEHKPPPSSSTKILSPIKLAIALLLQHPEIAKNIFPPESLKEVKVPGISILMELFKLLKTDPNYSTGRLLEHWRESKIVDQLAKLASWELIIPPAGIEAELKGVLEKILIVNREKRIEELITKSNEGELTSSEKGNLLQLLRERH